MNELLAGWRAVTTPTERRVQVALAACVVVGGVIAGGWQLAVRKPVDDAEIRAVRAREEAAMRQLYTEQARDQITAERAEEAAAAERARQDVARAAFEASARASYATQLQPELGLAASAIGTGQRELFIEDRTCPGVMEAFLAGRSTTRTLRTLGFERVTCSRPGYVPESVALDRLR